MSQATIAPPDIKTLADLRKRLGGIPLDRIWFHPAPGTATEKDVIEAEVRENRLCELVDGTRWKKPRDSRKHEWPRCSHTWSVLFSTRTTWESASEPTA